MTCTHPGHCSALRVQESDEEQPRGAVRPRRETCTKTRSTRIAGEEMCLRLLKAWALRGVESESKPTHKELWADVLEDSASGRLPDMGALDARVAGWSSWE